MNKETFWVLTYLGEQDKMATMRFDNIEEALNAWTFGVTRPLFLDEVSRIRKIHDSAWGTI
jgi:hypothetical protein